MCKLGFFEYLKQAGTVKLHEQNHLSDNAYGELKSAQKMLKNFIKDTSLKVDIYDINSVPEDKFVYKQVKDGVYVEVSNLLDDKVYSEEFYKRNKEGEHIMRQIFRFVEDIVGVDEKPIDGFMRSTRARFDIYLRKRAQAELKKQEQREMLNGENLKKLYA